MWQNHVARLDVADQPDDLWQLVYFGYDGHGSTRVLTSPAGEVTENHECDAFGELLDADDG